MGTDAAAPPKLRRRRGRYLLALVLLFLVLTIDLAPALPPPPPPTPEQVEAVHAAAQVFREQLKAPGGAATLAVTSAQMEQASALFSRLNQFGRVTARVEDAALRMTASRHLIGPLWINFYVRVDAAETGFPPMALTIGRLPLGRWVTGHLIRAGAAMVRRRGINLPPLDRFVRSLRFTGDTAVAAVTFPLDSGLIDHFPALKRKPIDAAATRFVYCRLIREDGRAPAADLATVVQRAFAPLPSRLAAEEQNRARFVALAMYVVSPTAGRLAPGAQQAAADCPGRPTAPRLVGRPDLAKHWSLSAALAVSLGEDIGQAMGEWKELSDSRPTSGSEGFSFVDLAADRAGLAAARRGSSPADARAVQQRLAAAREDDLLPVHALALAEGLSEEQFIARYRNQDSAQFTAAIARIDRVIARTVGR